MNKTTLKVLLATFASLFLVIVFVLPFIPEDSWLTPTLQYSVYVTFSISAILTLIFPILELVISWKKYTATEIMKILIITICCPVMGTVYLFSKDKIFKE